MIFLLRMIPDCILIACARRNNHWKNPGASSTITPHMGSPLLIGKQKLILGILATTSVGALLCWLLPSVWFWITWEVLAALMVAIGCFGEWYLFKYPATLGHETQHRARELLLIMLVAVGVTMEFLALTHTIPEAIRLEKDVAKADPLNQPITSVRAHVLLFTSGTNIWHPVGDDPAKPGSAHFVSLTLGKREEAKTGLIKLNLICRYSERHWGGDSSQWQLEFGPDPGAPLYNLTPSDTVKPAENWDLFLLHARFLRDRPQVLTNSELTLFINSTVKHYPIPVQQAVPQYGKYSDFKLIGSAESNGVIVLPGP